MGPYFGLCMCVFLMGFEGPQVPTIDLGFREEGRGD